MRKGLFLRITETPDTVEVYFPDPEVRRAAIEEKWLDDKKGSEETPPAASPEGARLNERD